jgi:uncharacterized membrane protein YhaH (DUF805 family)
MDTLLNAYTEAWRRSFDYTGRSDRGDYWWYILANFLISIILVPLSNLSNFFGWIYSILFVATLIPSTSLVVRRLRDAGKHWGWFFISLVPIIGMFWMIYLLIQPSIPG